ncbi:MAG: hypothetical protein H6555_07420 [Lewinellaceae bacterium]|nr:hypothetical protein [Lewinellaceae bacterium]
MIKYFRKIRQQFILEKKFRNYLLYAVGEILLVVFGILIALAIDNSNQNSFDRKKEQTYLLGLREEFQTSQRKLTELISVNQSNYQGAKKIITYISESSLPPTEEQFSTILFKTFAFDIAFNPNNSLLTEMINSGSLKDLTNVKLRAQLTNWISTLDDIAKQESDLRLQREKVLDMFRTNQHSIRTIFDQAGVSQQLDLPRVKTHISNLELLRDIEFENNILTFMLTCYATETNHYRPLLEDIQNILSLLESEIKK